MGDHVMVLIGDDVERNVKLEVVGENILSVGIRI
jgi:hypothetical protein